MTFRPLHVIFWTIGAAVLVAILSVGVTADRIMRIGAGYKAKIACSEVFLAGRDPADIRKIEFGNIHPLLSHVKFSVDDDAKSATAAGPIGLGRARAYYREGYGCTLANAGRLSKLPDPAPIDGAIPWPTARAISGEALPYVDYAAIDFALNRAFEDEAAANRAFLVAVDGKLVDERYADGFDAQTPFLSWSMAKSVTATMVGAAVYRGLIDIDDPFPVEEWEPGDKRRAITWRDMLHMQSGLEFGEDYLVPRSDVNRMLFEMADAGALAMSRPLIYAPGTHWYYSSGTTNLIQKILRRVLTQNDIDYYAFAREAVFDPIGAPGIVIEPDASGNFIGSSFVYATAREWARLGQLYLQDGVFNGERLLPEGWTQFVATPSGASDGEYGGQFWLNYDGKNGRQRFIPGIPEETYYMAGNEGQYVIIIPSKRMIVVRTGITRGQTPIAVVAPVVKELYDAVGDAS